MKEKPDFISLAWCGAAGLISLLVSLFCFEVTLNDLDVPVAYQMDGYLWTILVKGFASSGNMFWDERLGAPTGETRVAQFPVNALWHYLWTGLFTKLTGSATTAVNLYFFLGFPLAAITGFLVMKKLQLSNQASFLASLAFSLLPYHFYHAAHLTLQAYYIVPPAVYLCVRLLRPEGQGWNDKLGAVVLILGISSTYYSLFFCVLLALAGLLAATAWSSTRHLKQAAGYTALLIFAMVLGTNQTILTWCFEGRAHQSHPRYAFEAELNGLRLGQLLLPSLGHNWDAAVDFKTAYMDGKPITETDQASLGVLGAIGFLASVLWILSPRRTIRDPDDFHRLSILNVTCFLFATIGGVGSVTAVYFPALRCLTRISVLIGFISLCCVARLLDNAVEKLRSDHDQAIRCFLLMLLTPFVVWDLVPLRHLPNRDETIRRFRSDYQFVTEVEQKVPNGTAVFCWPYDSFPEGSFTTRLYLHSNHLRWSGGGVPASRQDTWYKQTAQLQVHRMLRELARRKFKFLCVDLQLAKHLLSQQELSAFQNNLSRYALRVATSEPKDLALYDLGATPLEIKTRSLELMPGKPYPKELFSGFSQLERAGQTGFVWSDGPLSVLSFPRLTTGVHELTLSAAALDLLGDVEVTVSINGQALSTFRITTSAEQILLQIPETLIRDSNEITLDYDQTLGGSSRRSETVDKRDLAVMFTRIEWAGFEENTQSLIPSR